MSVFERHAARILSSSRPQNGDSRLLRVDESGVWLDGTLAVRHSDITSVSLGLDEQTTVHIRTKHHAYSCPFTNREDADALLEALGRTPEETLVEIALTPSLLAGGFRSFPWWKVGLLLAVALGLIALLPVLARARVRSVGGLFGRVLRIGADGLRIRGKLADEFLAYGEIAAVAARREEVVVRLHDGREIPLPVEVGARCPDIVAAIQRAIAKSRAPSDQDAVQIFDDGVKTRVGTDGTSAERVAALRELGTETGASYRESRLPRERLWNIVEDPSLDGATRTHAAVVLSGNLTDEERRRLRVAADVSVGPTVRIAADALGDELGEKLDDVVSESAREDRRLR
jgi:hypothetical protein